MAILVLLRKTKSN